MIELELYIHCHHFYFVKKKNPVVVQKCKLKKLCILSFQILVETFLVCWRFFWCISELLRCFALVLVFTIVLLKLSQHL